MKSVVLLFRWVLEQLRIFSCFVTWGFKPAELGPSTHIDVRGCIRVGRNLRIARGASIVVESGAELHIGDDVFLGAGCFIKCYGGKLEIGNAVSINPYCFVNAAGGVCIGDATRIGAHSIIIASNHVFSDSNTLIMDQGTTRKGIFIGGNSWLGARVTVLDGVVTSPGSVFAAGAVVSRSAPEKGVYAGVPAELKKKL